MIVVVFCVLMPCCRAQESLLWEEFDLDELARSGRAYSDGAELTTSVTLDEGVEILIQKAQRYLPNILRESLSSAMLLVVVVLLCTMADGALASGSGIGSRVTITAGALAIAAASTGNVDTMMGLGRSTIEHMQNFSQVLLPTMAAVTAASGEAAGAAARQMATAACSGVLLAVIDGLLVPLVYAYITACTAWYSGWVSSASAAARSASMVFIWRGVTAISAPAAATRAMLDRMEVIRPLRSFFQWHSKSTPLDAVHMERGKKS